MGLAADLVRTCYASWLDGKTILAAQVMKQTKTGNIHTAFLGHMETFMDAMQTILSLAPALKISYAICFANMRVMCIINDMMLSNFMAARSGEAHIDYFSSLKEMIIHNGKLPLFVNINRVMLAVKTFDTARLDNQSDYNYYKDVLLMIQSADEFVKKDNNPGPFQAKDIHNRGEFLLDEVYL